MLYHPQNILESQRCIYFAKAVRELSALVYLEPNDRYLEAKSSHCECQCKLMLF